MHLWSLIPIKSFKRPKSRLNDVLSLEERRQLVKKMLNHAIQTFKATKAFDHCLIVTEDPAVAEFAKKNKCKVLLQKKPGLSQGVTEAALFAHQKGAKSLLIMHGDIPQVDESSILKIIKAHEKLINKNKMGITLSSDIVGEGSNCMICSPPNVIKFRYGIDSCSLHLEEADKLGVKMKLHKSSKLASDIDIYSDLDNFLQIKKFNSLEDYLIS